MKNGLSTPDLPSDAIDVAQSLLGMPIRLEQWNNEASRDTIRHYSWGIGDDNPLYCDPDYAATTRWKGIIAPPTFPYAIFDAVVAPGLPDIQWFYAGANWTFDRPIRRNESIDASAEYTDARQISGDRVSRGILQTGTVEYRDSNGERVAVAKSHCFRIPRPGAAGGLRYEARSAHEYSREELATVEKAVMNEYRRGGEALKFADINVGDKLPTTVRGPITQIDMTAYYAGAVGTSGYKSTKLRWKYGHWGRNSPDKLPNNYDPSYYSATTLPSIGHQDGKVAVSEIGMPGPYDNGPQRIGFMASCVTNWMGDNAQLREFSIRLRLPVIFGDITFTTGEVTGTERRDGEEQVYIRIWAENQLGQVTADGKATVILGPTN